MVHLCQVRTSDLGYSFRYLRNIVEILGALVIDRADTVHLPYAERCRTAVCMCGWQLLVVLWSWVRFCEDFFALLFTQSFDSLFLTISLTCIDQRNYVYCVLLARFKVKIRVTNSKPEPSPSVHREDWQKHNKCRITLFFSRCAADLIGAGLVVGACCHRFHRPTLSLDSAMSQCKVLL